MNLTDEQKLEMTETILEATGWVYVYDDDYSSYAVAEFSDQPINGYYYDERECRWIVDGSFRPFDRWNDAMRASEALDVVAFSVYPHTPDGKWVAEVETAIHVIPETHPDRLAAFCLALHEIAKAKLEETNEHN